MHDEDVTLTRALFVLAAVGLAGCGSPTSQRQPSSVAVSTSSPTLSPSKPEQCTAKRAMAHVTIGTGLTGGASAVFASVTSQADCALTRMIRLTVLQQDGVVVTDAMAYHRSPSPQSFSISEPLNPAIDVAKGATLTILGEWGGVCVPTKPPFLVRLTFPDGTIVTVAPSAGSSIPAPRCLEHFPEQPLSGNLPSGRLYLTLHM
jgi:hypothetical protein